MESTAPNYKLQVLNVYKSYGDKQILENVDLNVREGEFCSVVGPSGCGKSTLLRLILGQERSDAGYVLVDGKPVSNPSQDRGIVFQKYSLFPHLTVLQNVMAHYRLKSSVFARNKKAEIDEAMRYLERVHLQDSPHKYPHELSGGMQQRAAIAQALIAKPQILLMDEPFGALDPHTREDLQLFLLECWEEKTFTTFFVTHDLEEACFVGSRVLTLSQHYTDDRGDEHRRGAKIVMDVCTRQKPFGTGAKQAADFQHLIEDIRELGFDPDIRQHARDFNLQHDDAFQTLTSAEDQSAA